MRKSLRTKTEVEVVDIEEEDEGNVFDTEDEEEEEIKPKQINEADVELVQYSDDEEEADDKNEVIDKVLDADKEKGSGTEQEDNDVIQVDEAMFKVLEADKESGGVSTDQDEDEDGVQVGETANSSYWNIQARILRIKKGIRKQTNGERREDKRKNKSKSNMIDEVIIDDDDEEEEKEEEEKEMEMQCLDEKLISVKTQRVPLKKQRAWRQPRYEHTLFCLFSFRLFVCLFVCLFVLINRTSRFQPDVLLISSLNKLLRSQDMPKTKAAMMQEMAKTKAMVMLERTKNKALVR